ncbi:MAG: hypothetical protein J7K68_02230 [Candidatus Diapherotrites archaeon]|nr:hypothetical protein [Candidatus Diapherotrites archaeon]
MIGVEVAIALIGAALAVGIAGLSAGIGAGIAGAAGAGIVAENPKKFSTAIIFQAIPQTQGFYGFLIAVLIMMGVGILGGAPREITLPMALAAIGAGIAVGVAGLSAIGQGIASAAGAGATARDSKMFGKSMVFSVLPETQAIYGLLIAILILFFMGIISGEPTNLGDVAGLAAIGAGIAVGVAGLSAIGQGIAAASGVGAVSEKSELFGKAMAFSVLPETQAIYGLLIAILILFFIGIISGKPTNLGEVAGFAAIAAGVSIGFAGLSAIGQGIVASGGIMGIAKNPTSLGKGLVLAVIPETFAILGLLVAILIMLGVGLLG